MSSQPVFKVPRPVPVRYLITAEELKAMRGKIRCLFKLFKHPRRTLPRLQPYITFLLTSQNSFVSCSRVRYTKIARAHLEAGVTAMKYLEDIVIRVILRGEDPAQAHLRVINEIYPYNSDEDSNDDTGSGAQSSSECPAGIAQATPKQEL